MPLQYRKNYLVTTRDAMNMVSAVPTRGALTSDAGIVEGAEAAPAWEIGHYHSHQLQRADA